MNWQLLIFMIKHPEFSEVDVARIFDGDAGATYKNVNKLRRKLKTAEHQLHLRLKKALVAPGEIAHRETPETADGYLPPVGDSAAESPPNSEEKPK